jgi:hypothetical protein
MQITQLINSRGNAVANHFVILDTETGARYLQSYKSIVAKVDGNTPGWVFGPDWDYSVTTLKHLKTFLGFTGAKKQLEAGIAAGEITVSSIKLGA